MGLSRTDKIPYTKPNQSTCQTPRSDKKIDTPPEWGHHTPREWSHRTLPEWIHPTSPECIQNHQSEVILPHQSEVIPTNLIQMYPGTNVPLTIVVIPKNQRAQK